MHRMIANGERVDGCPQHVVAPLPDVVVDAPCHDQDNKKTELGTHDTQPTFICLVAERGEDEDHH